MFGSYSKLIGAVLGNILAIVLVWLGSKGFATCTAGPTPDADLVCTVMGMTSTQLTTYAMIGVNALFVYAFPANKPAA